MFVKWSIESQELKKHINSTVPFFIRGFVDKVITKAVEVYRIDIERISGKKK